MIQVISIFTMLSLLLGASLTVLSAKKALNKNLNTCISITTDLNTGRRTILNRLFTLNTKAKMLRQQRRMTEQVYRAAPPPGKPAAYAALQAVKVAQKVFRAYQQTIIKLLDIKFISFKTKARSKNYSILKISKKSLIKSYPKNTDSPSYKLHHNFSKISKVFVKKSFSLNKNFPKYFKDLINSKKGEIECGSIMVSSRNKKIDLKLLGGKSF